LSAIAKVDSTGGHLAVEVLAPEIQRTDSADAAAAAIRRAAREAE
jgi:hypothetical protein